MHRAHFGKFTLDPVNRVLLRDGSVVAVEPKVFECIELLATRAGALVRSEWLRRALWPDVRVGDAALRRVIAQARKVLEDRGDARHLILTRKKLGYVFAGTVVREPVPSRFAARHNGPTWPFVGRERELAELRGALSTAREAGASCFVSGEAGAGKSALLAQLRIGVLPGLGAWLVGRCRSGAGVPAFWPWRQIAAEWMEHAGVRERLTSRAAREPGLGRIIPELAGASRSTPASADADRRFEICEAFVDWLCCLDQERAVFIVLEDVHWADDGSLLLLELLGRATTHRRIFVLASYRPEEVRTGSALAHLLGRTSGRDGITNVHLSGLTALDLRALLAALEYPHWGPQTADALKRSTGGNPLLVQELVRHALNSETPLTDRPPPSFDHLVRERVRVLPDRTLFLLGRAAVLGAEFTVSMLAAVSACPVAQIRSDLEPAVRTGVLQVPDESNTMRFAHALLRDALYRALPEDERQECHAGALHAWKAQPRTVETMSERASHAYMAGDAVDRRRRRALCVQAGREAFDGLAFDRAAIHLGRALALWTDDGASSSKAELLLLLARALWEADAPSERVSRAFFEAAECARAAGAPRLLAQAAVGCVVGEGSIPTLRATRLGEWELPLLEEASLALETLDAGTLDPETTRLEYRVARALCLAHATGGDRRLAMLAARRAVRCAPPSGDAWTRASTIADMGSEALFAGDADETLAVIRELRPYCEGVELGARQRIELAIRLMTGCLCAGDASLYEAIRQGAQRALSDLPVQAHFGRLGERTALYTILPALGQVTVATIRGELAFAERLYGDLVQAGSRLRTPRARDGDVMELLTWLQLLGYQERSAELLPLLEERLAKFPEDAWDGSLALAQLGIETKAIDDARRHFEALRATDFLVVRSGRRCAPRLEAQVRMADVCCVVGDARDAARLCEILHPNASLCAGEGPLVSLGSMARPLGELCHQRGAYEDALEHFRHALARNERFGHRPEIARTRVALARTLCTLGRFEEALVHGIAAHTEASAMGMAPTAAAAAQLLPESRRRSG